MTRTSSLLALGVPLVLAFAVVAYALDPPHDSTNTISCTGAGDTGCHKPHAAAGGAITQVKGNDNLCFNCHTSGKKAGAKALGTSDEALPWPGLPSGKSPSGTSHRWDSGASGHVEANAANTSTGKVQSGGAYTGRYPKTYTITIATPGDAGVATFSWSDTLGGGASGLTAGTNVAFDQGITVTFTNGTSSPSFLLNDRWNVYVRTDINQPATAALAARISEGKIMCSTCHDQHSQAVTPFDPSAPAYSGSGTGAGRHYQRAANDTNQMCADCHSARNVSTRDAVTQEYESHPVGIAIPGTGFYKSPTTLPLDKTTSKVRCLTCHQPHYAQSTDGTLLRVSNVTTLCTDCHTLADTTTGVHLSTSKGALWPGGQYGSTFPDRSADASKRGFCVNCHQPHGWPDNANPSKDYPKLLADRQENLCFACHDVDGPAPDIYSRFNPATPYTGTSASGAKINQHHDITAADQTYSGGAVECVKCHNPHRVSDSYDFTSKSKISNPDDLSQNFVTKYATSNTYNYSGKNYNYYSASTDLNPTAPVKGTGAWASGYPDTVAFCLACHDGTAPPGVTISPSLINIASVYFTKDQHGAQAGGTGTKITNGYLKEPWTNQTTNPGQDPSKPYAAVPCNFCHEGHGSANLFQLRTSITIDGVQMALGSKSGTFGPGTFPDYGKNTYTLPVISGSQQDHYWGAWCTFCHDQATHPGKVETDQCQGGHMHGGGNF